MFHTKPLHVPTCFILLLLTLWVLTGCTGSENLFVETPPPEPTQPAPLETILVEVKGAVRFPGVYEIDRTHRLTHLLAEAGGATEDAELRHVNLAMKIIDGDSFYIPFRGENVEERDILVQESPKINVNRATREELMGVPGIGPATADNIIAFREENGGFRSLEDLLQVPRIGEKTLENLRAYLEVR